MYDVPEPGMTWLVNCPNPSFSSQSVLSVLARMSKSPSPSTSTDSMALTWLPTSAFGASKTFVPGAGSMIVTEWSSTSPSKAAPRYVNPPVVLTRKRANVSPATASTGTENDNVLSPSLTSRDAKICSPLPAHEPSPLKSIQASNLAGP